MDTNEVANPEVTETPVVAAPKRKRHRPTAGHNHGPNFGRYVANCDACAKKWPDGPDAPPATKPKAQRPIIEPAPIPSGLTMEQMMLMLQEQRAQIIDFARELKKPTEEEQAKKDAEQKRLIENRRVNVEAAQIEREQKERLWASCNHKMPRGENAVFGQVHTGTGLFHPICVICQKQFTPYKPHGEQMQLGVG